MDNILSFLSGVISSVVGSYILQSLSFIRRIIPPQFRKSFDREFKNQKKALRSIRRDAKKSSTMKVITMKGDTFSNPGDAGDLHDLLSNNHQSMKFLISNPNSRYVSIRGKELNSEDTFREGIQNSLTCFQKAQTKNSKIELRMHKENLRLRIIIFDECLYLSFQSTGTPGRLSPMQRYVRSSSGYSALDAYFDDLWSKYEPQVQTNKKVQKYKVTP